MKLNLKKIIFWGTPEFALPSLRALHEAGLISAVVTQPDKTQGRGRKELILSPVKRFAHDNNLKILQPSKIDEGFIIDLKKLLPATFMIVAYGKIIPEIVLELSDLPAINIHPSLLPILRGPSPIQSAIAQGMNQTGLTLMQLDKEVDHGPILSQKKISISPEDTYETLSEKLSFSSAQFVSKYVTMYLAGELKALQQDHQRSTMTKMIGKEDGLLDSSENAEILQNKVRAYNPWPGTYILWNNKRLKILQSKVSSKKPDTMFSRSGNNLLMKCGSGSLEISQVQLEGKSAVHVVDFLNGHPEILG